MRVTETIENEIEKLTSRFDSLTAEVVTLRTDIDDHYNFLGRLYYARRGEAAAAAALNTARAS
jgi:hypothetical protein